MEFINPLKKRYDIVVRITALIGVGLVISNFLLFPRFGNSIEFENVEQVIIENIDIPQTQQIDNTPPPARPSIPVPSDDEDIAEDLTLDELDFDDFFHAIVFELVSENMTFTFTRFDNYSSEIIE